MGWKVLASISSYAHSEQNSIEFTTSPNLALRKAADKAKVQVEELDLVEINEAFSAVGIVNTKLLGISSERVNVYGGAVAIGHPVGCSGARIVVTLINALLNEGGKLGGATICNGGGGATALIVQV